MRTSNFLPQEVIRKKRDGEPLSADEISQFISGLADESLSEGQAAAFAMAVFFNGMPQNEQVAMTLAMRDSGDLLDWSVLGEGAPVVDKHSTGGVGDKASLILAPMAAAAGAFVPMISGRGLGHTGGTLDKFESIPGYRAIPENDEFIRVVKEVGCAVIGQTSNLAPADKRFYAIRDVTATVESIPLITGSILSKKMAAGLSALAMDVKWGSGAFMTSQSEAEKLARNLAAVATHGGLPTTALLTDMNEVLGHSAGNAVEMAESVEFLTGDDRDPRLEELCVALVAEMLLSVGLASDLNEGRTMAAAQLTSGAAAEKFGRMVAELGGPADFVENHTKHLDISTVAHKATPSRPGFISRIDVRRIGNAVVKLGGGRIHPAEKVHHAVGLTNILGLGKEVSASDPLCFIHTDNETLASEVAKEIEAAFVIADEAPKATPIISMRIDGKELD
jgi:thymidine phosphorylase